MMNSALMILAICASRSGVEAQLVNETVKPGPGIYFVATDGNDNWSGRLPSPNADRTDGPFASLTRARDAVRQFKAQEDLTDITVYVRGGTYYLDEPLTLTAEDSGTAEHPIAYVAYPGEMPVLSGGRPIADWQRGEDEIWTAHISDVAEGKWYFRQLRVGDERQIRARYPNFDPENPYTGGWLFIDKSESPVSNTEFRFKPNDLKSWQNSSEPEIHIFPAWGWVNAILQVERIDHEAHTVYVKGGNCQQELRPGNRYYVSNLLEELDTPGEWYLDRESGTLYYWPKDTDFTKAGVVAPALDRVVDFVSDAEKNAFVSHIIIRGFTITDTTYSPEIPSLYTPQDAAIWLRDAKNCVIEGNRFINIGGYGVCLTGLSNSNKIILNEIAYGGQGGVLVLGHSSDPASASGDYSETNQPTNNLIAGNHIHDSGVIYKHVAGVYVPLGSGNRIAHNLIHHMPRYGISLKTGSHNNVVEYNEIHHINLETNDTGGIETLGRDKVLTGNVIRYNLIYDIIGLGTTPGGNIITPHYTWGIYLDDYSSGTIVFGNLVYRNVLGGVHVHGGKENVIENNILIDGVTSQVQYNNIQNFMENNRFVRNVVYYTNPDAVLFKSGGWNDRVVSESDWNIFFHVGSDDLASGENSVTPEGNFAQWQEAGYDRNSLVADPIFVNSTADDYRLKPESPALKLGFKPIPLDKIGPKGYVQ